MGFHNLPPFQTKLEGIVILEALWFQIWNNISVISWWLVLLVEETGIPGENHRPAASNWQTLSHDVVLWIPRRSGIRTHNVSGYILWYSTDCIGSCHNYKNNDYWINSTLHRNWKRRVHKTKKNKTNTKHNMCWTPIYANKHK